MSAAPAADSRTIIAETELLRVVYMNNGSKEVFVTFGNLTTPAKGAAFWGDSFFSKRGLSCIGFMPKGRTWFPVSDTRPAIEMIRPILQGHDKIIGYGQSKGGYAALKYSAALGSHVTIACAPQTSIVPAEVGDFDERYQSYYRPDWHDGMRIRAGDMNGRCIVVFDPTFAPDARHVSLIERERPVSRLLMPMFAHNVMNGFIEGGSTAEILGVLVEDKDDAYLQARQILKRRRLNQPSYARRMCYLSNRRRLYDLSLAMARRAVELAPNVGEYHLNLVFFLLRLGDFPGALRAFKTGESLSDGTPAFARRLEGSRKILQDRGVLPMPEASRA